jgi:D-alanine-D-alanine ligase
VKIGILYDGGSREWDQKDVAAVMGNVREVQLALRHAGHETTQIPVHLGDVSWLRRVQRTDLIFNLCEGVNGHARFEDYAVGALELTRVPFTGCPSWPVTICHRKHIANTLLAAAGVPVPPFLLARGATPPTGLRYPVIVKPSGEDASVGIDRDAVCVTRKALRERLAKMLAQWDEVMIQEYVHGREVNVGFIGRDVMPLSEIVFTALPPGSWPIVTYAAKWDSGSPEDVGTQPQCPAVLEPELAKKALQTARLAWDTLARSQGYGRVDLRINEQGDVHVLEVNPNPDLSSDAGLARMGRARGWDYDTLVHRIVDEALQRAEAVRAAAPASRPVAT